VLDANVSHECDVTQSCETLIKQLPSYYRMVQITQQPLVCPDKKWTLEINCYNSTKTSHVCLKF